MTYVFGRNGADARTYSTNRQSRTFNEVKIYHNEQAAKHAIEFRFRGSAAHHETDETNRAYDPMHFVLLFPCGEDGWQPYQHKTSVHGNDGEEHVENMEIAQEEAVLIDVQNDVSDGDEETNVQDTEPVTRNRQVSVREHYAYQLQIRERTDENGVQIRDNVLTRWGRLFQEYCCMALAKAEAQKLRYFATHQKEIRAELYKGSRDTVRAHDRANDGTELQIGKKFILPSSFTGGPRDQSRRYHDAMAVVRRLGKPSLFITMTCNPGWREILENMNADELAQDRPDLTARVFNLKLQSLLDELFKKGIFGKTIARLHVIEFQHRGLPHAHILIVLEKNFHTGEEVDAYITAELPVPPVEPVKPLPNSAAFANMEYKSAMTEYEEKMVRWKKLNDLVVRHMIHGPCGIDNPKAPCCGEKGGEKCAKHYPKDYSSETYLGLTNHIYPTYRRRKTEDGGTTFINNGREIDNRWVVSYSPYLLLKYECHINVEACLSVRGVKYLYKYVFKGPDRAMVKLHTNDGGELDEIGLYQDMRSLGSSEACWRTFGFSLYSRFPPVQTLALHLLDEQTTTFQDGNERAALDKGPPSTELTAWLQCLKGLSMNERLPVNDSAGKEIWSAKYCDWPERFVYNKKTKTWQKRKDNAPNVGRVYNAHPREGERFYLRLLLHRVVAQDMALTNTDGSSNSDAFTLEALKYFEDVKYATYKAAAMARNLLQDDGEWHAAMDDAKHDSSARQMRDLYMFIVKFNSPQDAAALFEASWEEMASDIRHTLNNAQVIFEDNELRARLMVVLEEELSGSGHTLDACNLSISDNERISAQRLSIEVAHSREPKEIRDELYTASEREELRTRTIMGYANLMDEQRDIYAKVVDAVEAEKGCCIFVDAPGGTGKTFTFNVILASVRSKGMIALAVASSGIAAILLEKGRTFHGRFKAQREPKDLDTFSISGQCALAALIRRASLIIWDEAAMGNRYSLEGLNRTLQFLMATDELFGGKVILLGGDYRQTLPIVKGATRSQILRITLTYSPLWPHFERCKLTKNMRVELIRQSLSRNANENDKEMLQTLSDFATWLLQLGSGQLETDDDGCIQIPKEMCMNEGLDIDALVGWVYPNLAQNCKISGWLSTRAILAPLHEDVNMINDYLTDSMDGDEWKCESADTVNEADKGNDHNTVGAEVLNAFNAPGLPLHILRLKKDMPIMLMRNLAPERGLCNGTRLLIQNIIGGRVIRAQIVTGTHAGELVNIPRMNLTAEAGHFTFEWSRRQFPIRIAFAMTINKAQGQTLERVGIFLKNRCFAHGQLYVAASRVGHPLYIRFALEPSENGTFRAHNVVYPEVLT